MVLASNMMILSEKQLQAYSGARSARLHALVSFGSKIAVEIILVGDINVFIKLGFFVVGNLVATQDFVVAELDETFQRLANEVEGADMTISDGGATNSEAS